MQYMPIHTCLSIHTNTDHIVKRHLKLASQTQQDTALTALTARGTHGCFKKVTRPGNGGDLVQNVFDAGKCLFDLLLVSCHWSIDGLGPVCPAESEPVSGRTGHATGKHKDWETQYGLTGLSRRPWTTRILFSDYRAISGSTTPWLSAKGFPR